MNKKYHKTVVIIVIAIVVFLAIQKNMHRSSLPAEPNTAATAGSIKNATYTVDDQPVTLVNGVSDVEAAPGSATHVVTQYFGNEASGDLNGDGIADMAFIITQNGGGTGTFYYAVAALSTKNGIMGT